MQCVSCQPSIADTKGRDCFRGKASTRGTPCCWCILNNVQCVREHRQNSLAAGSDAEVSVTSMKRKRAGTVYVTRTPSSEGANKGKKNAKVGVVRESAPSPPPPVDTSDI